MKSEKEIVGNHRKFMNFLLKFLTKINFFFYIMDISNL